MTFVVPNYFLEEKPANLIVSDSLFSVTYSSRHNNDNIAVRNTTHVMIFLLKGRKKLRSLDAEQNLVENDILLLTQGNYFMSEIVGEAGAYEAIMIYFDDIFVADFIAKYHIDLENAIREHITVFHPDALLKHLIDSYRLYSNRELDNKSAIIKLKTQEIFLHLLESDKARFSGFLYAVISDSKERIRHVLEANIDLIESVEDMCRIARVGKGELRAALRNSLNLLPKEWLNKKRLEQAVILLRTTDKTISDIATTCGYATVSWFGVQFKKEYRCTPKEYRIQLG